MRSVVLNIQQNKQLNDIKYLILDNASILKNKDMLKVVEESGLEIVYLPPYSPALNAIEEFWAVCKSKVKAKRLTAIDDLSMRVNEACQEITTKSYQGFCRHASRFIEPCLKLHSI